MNIRNYMESDFDSIQQLNHDEGWNQLVERDALTREAWRQSNVAYVMESEEGTIIAYLRGLTDTTVSLYVCELLVASAYRKRGLGEQLLRHVHTLYPDTRLEMLASQNSYTYYEKLRFRPFYGFRKTIHE
ncbi:GCN5-related N-acetyltransferase [Exiguobacterium sp. AT1b]|uniref:GCN5-related N-acetyltransferase n=1 Tax=Exiguobacterium sp. (strain ATCC BAA-1283 / AT1b) TaxID=360911 RepID=C4KZ95_EXISA|nr:MULTISPECIES: GNAT family N-acetyltransferase [unclassified Exiguobacterium]ACQ70408.1 GCN5-related N-acetyltransferase [Exiguobacterium sp. AT1b]